MRVVLFEKDADLKKVRVIAVADTDKEWKDIGCLSSENFFRALRLGQWGWDSAGNCKEFLGLSELPKETKYSGAVGGGRGLLG